MFKEGPVAQVSASLCGAVHENESVAPYICLMMIP